MIYYSGMDSVMDQLQQHLNGGAAFLFEQLDDPLQIARVPDATVFLIGPDEPFPVRIIQQIATLDKHLSIVLLSDKHRYLKIKQAVNLSPFVGKNVTCVAFHPGNDYSGLLETAKTRTAQKRNFSRINFAKETIISRISSPELRLENLGHALEHAPIGVLLLHESGTIIGANRKSRDMFGELAVNQSRLQRLFPEEHLSRINNAIYQGGVEVLEVEDFEGRYYEVSSTKVREDEGEHMLLLINDITERKEKDKKLEAILESLPQIAWTATPEGEVNFYSQGWYSYTNQTHEEAIKDGWVPVVHPDDVKMTLIRWKESIRNQVVFQHALRFRKFDGEYRWHLSRAVPVFSGKHTISMWVGTSTDIHDQVMLAENLEKKVKERTRSLEAANEELEQFAYVSSHDLQEPLRKIQTFADLIRESANDTLDEGSRTYLAKIITTATRMSKLLKDLLNFSRLHHSEEITAVDIGEIVSGICEDLELVISQSQAEIRIENELPTLPGYHAQLKQLFYNLINNSLKFRSPDRLPLIRISSRIVRPDELTQLADLHPDGDYWEVIVGDNGIGFEQKYADQIFTIFQRLHGKSKYEGTGIGLAICRKVVSNHGGTIYALSSPEQGAEFHMLLPAVRTDVHHP